VRSTVILHIGQSGGPPQHIRPWLEALAARGPLEVIAPARGSALELFSPLARTTALDYSALLIPRRLAGTAALGLRLTQETARLYAYLRQTKPDLVVVVTSAVPSALVAARAAKIPTIVYAAELLDARPGVRGVGSRIVRGLVERLATAIVCASRRVESQFGRRATAVTVYPAIDMKRISVARGTLRDRVDERGGRPCLAVIGNVTRGRGQDLAIRALSRLEELPDAWLLVAGAVLPRPLDVAYDRELRKLAADLSLTDRVVLAGFVDPVADAFEVADIVINAKRGGEGLGMTTLEALAMGKPVVSTARGGLSEVLVDGSNALLVDDDDVEALAASVLRLWRDPALRDRLVAKGREEAGGVFAEETSVRRFLDVVDAVVPGAG
jgi:glycosyltransferase involved in cell wall biosynthesis